MDALTLEVEHHVKEESSVDGPLAELLAQGGLENGEDLRGPPVPPPPSPA